MIVGLIDVDSHGLGNLALMRVSAWHKAHGNDVEWVNGIFTPQLDRTYVSKIFTFSPMVEIPPQCGEIVKGGTGFDIRSRLPEEIEQSTAVDYDIYPDFKFSLQFFSRGCIRHCPFCLVHDKEGGIHAVEPLELNPRGEWVEVLDNNFFASPEWKSAVDYLIKLKQPVNLHGVDVRIMTE